MIFSSCYGIICKYEIELSLAFVAQGIEQRFPVPRVGGSNPLGRDGRCPQICLTVMEWEGIMKTKNFREFIARHYRYLIVGGLFLILVIVLIVFLATKGTNVVDEEEMASTGVITSSIAVPKDKYEVDAYPSVNTIVTTYMDAMSQGDSAKMASLSNSLSDERRAFFEVQAQYIGSYSDYHFYTKKGPQDNSYIVLATYNLLISGDTTKIPGLLSLYVCTDTTGALYINNEDLSDDEEAYILEIVSQDDFVKLQDEVQLEYNKIIDKDTALAARVSELRTQINSDVQSSLEQQKQEEADKAAQQAAEEAEAEKKASATTVKATDVVNIRKEANTDAESLGKAEVGQKFTRIEVMDNGWSRIEYNGAEAFIKTEFLEEVSDSASNSENENKKEESSSNKRSEGDTIKVKENVNIRSESNTDSEVLGKASAGDTFTLKEEKDGWCKIKYDGKDAYIKSDYVE